MASQASQRSLSSSAVSQHCERRKSKSRRRCWFGCIWLSSRVSLIRSSGRGRRSPDPYENVSLVERITAMLNEKPIKMSHMLKSAKYISNMTYADRKSLFDCGVIHSLLDLIGDIAISDSSTSSSRSGTGEQKRRTRRNSSASLTQKGIGYGTGSTRSRWDIERTVEEKMVREENLTWLLNVLNAWLISWPIVEKLKAKPEDFIHMNPLAVTLVAESSIISILEYNLRNDSFFDVSEHLEIYQALLETAACMASIPGLVPYLVKPYTENAKSIAKELIPRFKDNILEIQAKWGGTLEENNFRMADFSAKVTMLSDLVIDAARVYEATLPPEQRIQTATQRRPSGAGASVKSPENDGDAVYRSKMNNLQLQNARFIGDFGKLCVPYAFKKDAKSINPFSPHLRDRTKRIAKELASIANALPMNASNSIYVCYDEGRVDIIKVLISGPDDTPYANGLFEFDVFFPTGYPFAPPKCAFLTTGAGNVRFNPNLYNDGKICLSILGTWEGRPEEKWNPYCSLMQVLVSIQGLIFVKDPYFNEPGFERYQGTERGDEYSRKYNLQIEHATLNYAIREQLKSPSECFKEVIQKHFWLKRQAIIEQARKWLANVKKDFGEDKNSKRKDAFAFENGFNPFTQERVIQNLINELTNMNSPFAKEEKDEEEQLEKERLENEKQKKKDAENKAQCEKENREVEEEVAARRASAVNSASISTISSKSESGEVESSSISEPSSTSLSSSSA